MRVLQFLALCLLAVPALPTQHAHAQAADPLVKIRILPERTDVKPGEEIWISIEQSIAPEWHTYWKNPGDSGSAPRIDWDLPNGFSISDIEWPTPEKIPYPPLLNYGYSNNTVLLQRLQVPSNLPDGAIVLNADIEILVCKEECIPEFSEHSITLNDISAPADNNRAIIRSAIDTLPQKTDRPVFFSEDNGQFILHIPAAKDAFFSETELASIKLFPEDWGIIDNPSDAKAVILDDGSLEISQKRGDRNLAALEEIKAVIAYNDDAEGPVSFEFSAASQAPAIAITQSAAQNSAQETAPITTDIQSTSFAYALLFAIFGGLILNLMPCVFPVLSIKALSLVKISEKHPELARKHGIAYTGGIVLSLLVIASILIALKAGGSSVGWGFQLQNPIIVSLLAYMLFLVGLNLSGYFEIGSHFGGIGQKLTQGEGLKSSFFTGVLATLVATPCTAPFMAVAIGYALTQGALTSLSIFAALGFGLALPYLMLAFIPALQSRLPKPGPWMRTFQQFLAFPMFASAVWLVWVVGQQAGPIGMMGLLFGMTSIAFGLWLVRIIPANGIGRFILKALIVISLLVPLGLIPSHQAEISHVQNTTEKKFGEAYSPDKLEALLAADAPIFVEMTAAWCITCKVNHAIAINTKATKTIFANNNVQYVVGDWTNYDADITKFLNSYGREGVPIYVYYGPRDGASGKRPEPKILPQILTPDTIRKAIENS